MQSQAEFPAFQGGDGTKNSTRSGVENPKAHGNWSRGLSIEAMRAKLQSSDSRRQFSAIKRPERLRLKLKQGQKARRMIQATIREIKPPARRRARKSIFGEAQPREISLKQQGRVEMRKQITKVI